jgi:hypothetical protein
MSTHGKRLLGGVRELVRTDGTTLGDIHIIITDLVGILDKKAVQTVKKLKSGQEILIYDVESNKEYGTKGSELKCFFKESYEPRTALMLRVYDPNNAGNKKLAEEWSVSLDCLLEVFDAFDPDSDEGKKRNAKAKPKKRGRRPKHTQEEPEDSFGKFDQSLDTNDPRLSDEFEEELDGEEYSFGDAEEWKEIFDDE